MKRIIISIAILIIGAALGGLITASLIIPNRAEAQDASPTPKSWIGIEIAQRGENVVIVRVVPDSPAQQAGLEVKDIILSIGGTKIEKVKDVLDIVKGTAVGEKLNITVKRGEQELTVEVTVVELQLKSLVPKLLPKIGPWLPHPYLWLPPLEELRGIAPQERFQHFIKGEFVYTDKDGNRITVKVTPGVIASVGADSITIQPNGETGTITFTTTDKTVIRKGAKKASLSELKEGEQVIVVTVNDDTRLVLTSPKTAFRPPLRPGWNLLTPEEWPQSRPQIEQRRGGTQKLQGQQSFSFPSSTQKDTVYN
ncbi:MAG: PDZ domain-containing protein [Chloroflexi bacterium]|nr:PDZ domain-containing protein [Chloroflexota bacterium]